MGRQERKGTDISRMGGRTYGGGRRCESRVRGRDEAAWSGGEDRRGDRHGRRRHIECIDGFPTDCASATIHLPTDTKTREQAWTLAWAGWKEAAPVDRPRQINAALLYIQTSTRGSKQQEEDIEQCRAALGSPETRPDLPRVVDGVECPPPAVLRPGRSPNREISRGLLKEEGRQEEDRHAHRNNPRLARREYIPLAQQHAATAHFSRTGKEMLTSLPRNDSATSRRGASGRRRSSPSAAP